MIYSLYFLQFPKPGSLPKEPLKPHEHTLGDIILGTPKILEDCKSDGVELDGYLPVGQSQIIIIYSVFWNFCT